MMCKQCGIEGFKTNHSLRATAATRLYASGIDEQLVMERTGHRSLEGIRSYKRTTSQQKETVSDILCNAKKHCSDLAIPGQISYSETRNDTSLPLSIEGASVTSSTCTTASELNHSKNASLPGAYIFNQCGTITININSSTS